MNFVARNFIAILGFAAPLTAFSAPHLPGSDSKPSAADAEKALSALALPFVVNRGQMDPRVAYAADTFAGRVFVTTDGQLVYALAARRGEKSKTTGASLVERFDGSSPRPRGEQEAVTRVSYFVGKDDSKWRSNLATYDSVALGEVWKGIEVRLAAHGNNIEKTFTVMPGSNPSRIRMAIAGASRLSLAPDGGLIAHTRLGPVRFTPPFAYQYVNGSRREVRVAYSVSGRRYGFEVGAYDGDKPLVVDPLLQSTYFAGPTSSTEIVSIAAHPTSGEIYVLGSTGSSAFPGTAGGAIPTGASGGTIIARLNTGLTSLLQATYFSGGTVSSSSGTAKKILVTESGVYVGGFIGRLTPLPGTSGGAITSPSTATNDGYVSLFSPSLQTLIRSTYITSPVVASASTQVHDLLAHPNGDIYASGSGYPGTYVTRLSPTLTSIVASLRTMPLGATSVTMAVKPSTGDIYVTAASTASLAGGAISSVTGGGVPLSRIPADLSTVYQSTYIRGTLNGNAADATLSIAVHPLNGDIYGTGLATSGFPATAGGWQPAPTASVDNIYVARLNDSLTSFVQATYFGDAGLSRSTATTAISGPSLSIHPLTGDVLIGGTTTSVVPGAAGGSQAQRFNSGNLQVAFFARFNAGLTSLLQSTYLGDGSQILRSSFIHPLSNNLYAAGSTQEPTFPGAAGGFQPTIPTSGLNQGFIASLSADLKAAIAAPGTVQFSAPTYTTSEGGVAASIAITRTGGSLGAVAIDFTTGGGTATAGADYTATSTTVSFADGDTAPKTVSIPIVDDGLVEGDETVNLTLANPSGGATLGAQSSAVLTITDNDTVPSPAGKIEFSSATYSVTEGTPTATVTLIRSGGTAGAIAVNFATANGTAFDGSDYTGTATTVSFADGDNTPKTVSIPITDDSSVEPAETVNLSLTAIGGTLLGPQTTAVLTITDNDVATPTPPASGPASGGSASSGGGGGCTLGRSDGVDPTLLLLVLLAALRCAGSWRAKRARSCDEGTRAAHQHNA